MKEIKVHQLIKSDFKGLLYYKAENCEKRLCFDLFSIGNAARPLAKL